MRRWFSDWILALVLPNGVGLTATLANGVVQTMPWSYIGVMWVLLAGWDLFAILHKLE